jgi:altronate hydrolase
MRINQIDNVEVDLSTGHKKALVEILEGEKIVKYGMPIGVATCNISSGEHVHSHNIKTLLNTIETYEYMPVQDPIEYISPSTIMAYEREDGQIGIRNEIWIVATVGCINKTVERLARMTGAKAITHPYGCSQLGGDLFTTQKILAGLVHHPNAGGVLVYGLGCENNTVDSFKQVLKDYNPNRVKFVYGQLSDNDIEESLEKINELKEYAAKFKRSPQPISKLKVGLKCGGSDGYSGLSANPLVGMFSDKLISQGGSTALTEVPEMFGAERLLMNRCVDVSVFNKTVDLINNFKRYFQKYNQVIYENPSPGNKEGGITTLEDKSLGCIQKGGRAMVVDVLDYGEPMIKKGLHLINGPGNDLVSITNLTAAGCQLILFTTGRGTPLGGLVPTIKIASNNSLATRKAHWIDYDASPLLDGEDIKDDFFDYVIEIINGKETLNELNGYAELAIFKDGITL